MMDGSGNCGSGLIADPSVDLVENINFWNMAFSGASPHSLEPHQHQHHHHHHHQHDDEQQQQMDHHPPHHLDLIDQPVRRELFSVETDPRLEPFVGMEFDSGEAAKTFYIAYAGRIGFSVRIARSRRSKCNETVIMLRFVCSREGFSREKRIVEGKKTRKRAASIREGCKAMLEVIRRGDEKWAVTKLVKDHNHEIGMPSRVHYIATEGDGELEPYIGMEFDSLEIAKTFYYAYASRVGFEARVRQSRRSLHDESLKMLKLVCSKHRYHSGREIAGDDGRRGLIQDQAKEGCEALFEIIRKDGDVWMVSKLILEHSHELTPSPPSKVRCVRSQGEILVIAKNFSDTRNLLLNGQDSQNYLREIRYNDLGPEDAQSLLDYLKKTEAENPAFCYAVQVENNNCMTNIFWADAKARLAYNYFGDAVTFDMRYKNDKEFMPIVTFTGVNHHVQPVVFGCALLVDESEASFVWLFEQWLAAMSLQEPISLVTCLNRSVASAVAKVFPNTRHCFCKRHVLTTVQEELPHLFASHIPFEEELGRCINETETCDAFESCWETMVDKYDLRENTYLHSLHNIRHQWVPAYLRGTFFADVSVPRSSENIYKFIEKYCTAKTSLRVGIKQLGQALASSYDKEAQADYVSMFDKPYLRTASPMEKQAAAIYTRIIFDRFQEEFVESLGYHVDKIDEGTISKYRVARNVDDKGPYTVTFNSSEHKAHCSCCMFEVSGILCRHALRVFIVAGVRALPREYILKRWTKHAKSCSISEECGVELRGNCEEPSIGRYNDLCRDAIKCAKEGSATAEVYKVAKDALQKAIGEVVSAKQRREQQSLQSFLKSQKKQPKKLGKVTPKSDSSSNNMKRAAPKSPLEDDLR